MLSARPALPEVHPRAPGLQAPTLVSLGETLRNRASEIVIMWRFTKNNGITEGFHNKMEALSKTSLRVPELRELPTTSEGKVLVISVGDVVTPINGVEPRASLLPD